MRGGSPPLDAHPGSHPAFQPTTPGFAAASVPLRNPLATEDEINTTASRIRDRLSMAAATGSRSAQEEVGMAPPSSARLSLGAPRSRRAAQNVAGPSMAGGSPVHDQAQNHATHDATSAGSSATPETLKLDADTAVRATDSDALISRLSALEAGYLTPDPFAALFLSSPHARPPAAAASSSSQPAGDGAVYSTHAQQAFGSAERVGAAGSLPSAGLSRYGGHHIAGLQGPTGRGGANSPPPFAPPFVRPSPAGGSGVKHSSVLAPGSGSGSTTSSASTTRRPPVLNIGTYLRCTALDRVVHSFLRQSGDAASGRGAHIVSIGAGSDSRFWRIQADPDLRAHLAHYTELDFRAITEAKVRSIRKSQTLSSVLIPTTSDPGPLAQVDQRDATILSEKYSLLPCDLRTIAREEPDPAGSSSTSIGALIRAHIQHHSGSDRGAGRRRTLILAECVLAYLDPRDADALLSWFAALVGSAGASDHDDHAQDQSQMRAGSDVLLLSFDMSVEGSGRGDVEGGGRFGRMMLQNIESRGLPLHGARAYSTPSAYTRRYARILSTAAERARSREGVHPTEAGLSVRTDAKTLTQLWNELEASEKMRISRLERLDEVEELEMLMDHYCISWGAVEASPSEVPL